VDLLPINSGGAIWDSFQLLQSVEEATVDTKVGSIVNITYHSNLVGSCI